MGFGSWITEQFSKYWMKRVKTEARTHLCDFERISYELRPADVILIEGQHRISSVIKRLTQSPWTHSALYIGYLRDIQSEAARERILASFPEAEHKQLMIESILGEGTIVSPINNYNDLHIRICRPQSLSRADVEKVIDFASSCIGKSYNLRQFIDLGRFLLASRLFPGRLGSSLFTYEPGKATQDICSTMIAEAFMSINYPIIPHILEKKNNEREFIHRNPKLFTPSDFDYSPYFNIVKYPMFPITEQAPYRKLPWNEEGVFSNDDNTIIQTKGTIKPDDDKHDT